MQSGKVRLTFWLALQPSPLPRFVLRECSRQSVKLFGEWDAYGMKQQQKNQARRHPVSRSKVRNKKKEEVEGKGNWSLESFECYFFFWQLKQILL